MKEIQTREKCPYCKACGYIMTGITAGTSQCPKCLGTGYHIEWRTLDKLKKELAKS